VSSLHAQLLTRDSIMCSRRYHRISTPPGCTLIWISTSILQITRFKNY